MIQGKYMKTTSNFDKKTLVEKGRKTYKKKILCEELECNKYKQLTVKCLYIHKELYHGNQQYKENCRSI